jgi:hypothetical protein
MTVEIRFKNRIGFGGAIVMGDASDEDNKAGEKPRRSDRALVA